MVFENDCSKLIFEEFPDFVKSKHWQEHLEFWNGEKQCLGLEMAVFSHFISDSLNKNIYHLDFKKVFNFIEFLLSDGDADVQNAATTQFLENLINRTSSGVLDPKKFISLLGPRSCEFCKAWDEFTGVKTEGLWNNIE